MGSMRPMKVASVGAAVDYPEIERLLRRAGNDAVVRSSGDRSYIFVLSGTVPEALIAEHRNVDFEPVSDYPALHQAYSLMPAWLNLERIQEIEVLVY